MKNGKGTAAVETAQVSALKKELKKLRAIHGDVELTEIWNGGRERKIHVIT